MNTKTLIEKAKAFIQQTEGNTSELAIQIAAEDFVVNYCALLADAAKEETGGTTANGLFQSQGTEFDEMRLAVSQNFVIVSVSTIAGATLLDHVMAMCQASAEHVTTFQE